MDEAERPQLGTVLLNMPYDGLWILSLSLESRRNFLPMNHPKLFPHDPAACVCDLCASSLSTLSPNAPQFTWQSRPLASVVECDWRAGSFFEGERDLCRFFVINLEWRTTGAPGWSLDASRESEWQKRTSVSSAKTTSVFFFVVGTFALYRR